ncbi:NAD(P)-binding protein [Cylindrobasidium torrendii FP15055 ss-10]|uniref:NAD(P)-binding protein n=1 Tax=Cylindrobasidium torrendii FP15055 ss-10 TaxID=1314674 RepID=A0A0D7AZ07_9AGAR|nr:NAD(P)-binding protein [Cylindrobasidium torrendii FP15055 ss-10]
MSSLNPLVLVVGATGYTGSVVVKYLLESGNYRVAILVREKSLNKPAVKELTDVGAELRVGDISESEEAIVGHLQGVDILISLVLAMVDQKPLFRAAKKVGTQPRGIMDMHDKKLGVRDFVKELGLPHTFIEVGWWFINLLPFPHATPETLLSPKKYVGDKQKKLIISTLHTIGLFITKVLTDPRTLNQTVVIHDGEMTLGEAYALAEKTTGEDFSDYTRVPDEVVLKNMESSNIAAKIYSQYQNSLYLRGDNVLSGALARGALDARALYPEIPNQNMEEEAKKYYENPQALEYDLSGLNL